MPGLAGHRLRIRESQVLDHTEVRRPSRAPKHTCDLLI